MTEAREDLPFQTEFFAKQVADQWQADQFHRDLLIELPVHPASQVDRPHAAAPQEFLQSIRAEPSPDVRVAEFPGIGAHVGSRDAFLLIPGAEQSTRLLKKIPISGAKRFETRGSLLRVKFGHFVEDGFQAAPAF